MDLDGDGIMDAVGIDLDGDGVVDVIGVDKDGDGKITISEFITFYFLIPSG